MSLPPDWHKANFLQLLELAGFRTLDERKADLLAIGLSRLYWPQLQPKTQALIEAIEARADDLTRPDVDALDFFNYIGEDLEKMSSLNPETWLLLAAFSDGWQNVAEEATEKGIRRESLCDWETLTRDVYANPCRPVAFAPEWRTPTAVGLARSMYDARDFANMPVLADALEEAGCDSADVLAHCRGPGPHVRGCWVVDHVLGLG